MVAALLEHESLPEQNKDAREKRIFRVKFECFQKNMTLLKNSSHDTQTNCEEKNEHLKELATEITEKPLFPPLCDLCG